MHEDLVAAYIDRCGGTLLDVNSSSDSDKNSSFLKRVILPSHIHRIRIPCVPWYHIGEISDAFETPLPLLRDADLSIDYDLSPPPFERPFLAGATNLVSLRLSDYNINSGALPHLIIPTLTHLSLSFTEPRVPMVGELPELLRDSPLIEDLLIHAEVVLDASEESSAFPDRFQPVDLPCLRSIHLSWAMSRSQYTLLANIQHPANCSVSMQARSDSDIAQPPQNVFPKSWDAFSLPNLTCVTLRMKRERLSTECAVIAKKSNGTSVSISHLHNVDGDGNVIREPSRDRDDSHVLSDAIALFRKLPLHWIRKFVLEDPRADEMSVPESFEIPLALVGLIVGTCQT